MRLQSSFARDMDKLLRQLGWTMDVRRSKMGDHFVYRHPDFKQAYIMSKTPGDHRAKVQAVGVLRRFHPEHELFYRQKSTRPKRRRGITGGREARTF